MAKYTVTRKISDKETIRVEQAHSFDECWKILDRGETERKAMLERRNAPPVPPEPPAETPATPPSATASGDVDLSESGQVSQGDEKTE